MRVIRIVEGGEEDKDGNDDENEEKRQVAYTQHYLPGKVKPDTTAKAKAPNICQ